MTASRKAKEAGLDSLKELSSITGVSDQTLINWYSKKRTLFNIVVLGAKAYKDQSKEVK